MEIYERHKYGKMSEFYVAYLLTKNNYDVFLPTGNPKYDLIAEKRGERLFIQVKSGRRTEDTLKINLRGNSDTKAYTHKDVNVFAIHERKDNEVYFIPQEEVSGQVSVCLRFTKPPRIISHRTRFASDYRKLPLEKASA